MSGRRRREADVMDWKIELVPISVEDVDRSVDFYGNRVGWNVDFDQKVTDDLRFVQVTPPGSACSICFGTGLDMMPQGSSQFIQIVVASATCRACRDHPRARLVEPVETTRVRGWSSLSRPPAGGGLARQADRAGL